MWDIGTIIKLFYDYGSKRFFAVFIGPLNYFALFEIGHKHQSVVCIPIDARGVIYPLRHNCSRTVLILKSLPFHNTNC